MRSHFRRDAALPPLVKAMIASVAMRLLPLPRMSAISFFPPAARGLGSFQRFFGIVNLSIFSKYNGGLPVFIRYAVQNWNSVE